MLLKAMVHDALRDRQPTWQTARRYVPCDPSAARQVRRVYEPVVAGARATRVRVGVGVVDQDGVPNCRQERMWAGNYCH